MGLVDNVRKGLTAVGVAGVAVCAISGLYNGVRGEIRSNYIAYTDTEKVTREDIEEAGNNYRWRNISLAGVLASSVLIAVSYKKKDDDCEDGRPR